MGELGHDAMLMLLQALLMQLVLLFFVLPVLHEGSYICYTVVCTF
jgi:hypothetical protein